MEFDVGKYPIRLEFISWLSFDKPNTLIIDFLENEFVTEFFVKAKDKVKIKKYDIAEEITEKLLSIISREELEKYVALPKGKKTEKSYRDGWYTKYKIVFENGEIITGSLSTRYKENPLEKVLKYMVQYYPKIEILRSF